MDTATYYNEVGTFIHTFQRVKWALEVLVRQMECVDAADHPALSAGFGIRELSHHAAALFERTGASPASKRQFHALMKDLKQLAMRHDDLLDTSMARSPAELQACRSEIEFILQTLRDIATDLDCDDQALARELQDALGLAGAG